MSTQTSADAGELELLLKRTGQGDRAAFTELYRLTSHRLFPVCRRVLFDGDDAEEALQEAFVTIWKRADRFDPSLAGAMTWLVTVVRNKAIDRLRQRPDVRIERDVSWDDLVDDAQGPADGAEAHEHYGRLRECLDELEAKQKRFIREAFFGGLTYNQLAERASVPLGTMKSWIRRGLLQLRACLDT